VRAKECEIFNPENSQYNGFLQIIISNMGRTPSEKETIQSVASDSKVGR